MVLVGFCVGVLTRQAHCLRFGLGLVAVRVSRLVGFGVQGLGFGVGGRRSAFGVCFGIRAGVWVGFGFIGFGLGLISVSGFSSSGRVWFGVRAGWSGDYSWLVR